MKSLNSLNSEQYLQIDNKKYKYFDLNVVADKLEIDLNKIPISIKIILENLLK